MMTTKQAALQRFFIEKGENLQNEIDMEIDRIGGEGVLISLEDLLHWVYYARNQSENYYTICRMLEDKAEGADTGEILAQRKKTMETDREDIEVLKQKQEEEKRALEQLREEAEYYRQALEVLGQ